MSFEESYKHSLSPARMPTREGLLYEPRAFWSFGRFDTTTTRERPQGTVVLDRAHFYNGESYPVTLLYALTCPLNYIFDVYRETGAGPYGVNGFRNNGVAAMLDTQMVLSMRHRQHYARIPGLLRTMPPLPRWEPPWIDPAGAAVFERSAPLNAYAWEFDAPMVIPNRASVDFELSCYSSAPFVTPPRDLSAWLSFQEIGALSMKGVTRINQFAVPAVQGVGSIFPTDGFGNGAQGGPNAWSAAQKFSAKEFSAQSQSSDGSVPIVGFSAMLDQQLYDDSILANLPGAADPAVVISPMGFRVGTRARMRQGGTGAWWWREGAPLALVSPSRTPAQVHELARPITLGPGDNLEVELTFPQKPASGDDRITQVAVSFCGYAAIEG